MHNRVEEFEPPRVPPFVREDLSVAPLGEEHLLRSLDHLARLAEV